MKKPHAIGTQKRWWSSLRYQSSLVLIAALLVLAGCGRSDQFGAATTAETAYPAPNAALLAASTAPPMPTAPGDAYPAPPTSPPSQTSDTVIDYFPGQLGIVVDPTGNVVVDVRPNSPAQAAGIQVGDIITQVEGQPVGDKLKKAKEVLGPKYRKPVKLEIMRKGKKQTLTMIASDTPAPTAAPGQPTATPIPVIYVYL